MANQSAKVFNIDLKSELLTTLNKNDIKQFTGFNQRNCLYANDGLKRFKVSSTPYIYDDKGNYYSLENDQFKINGIANKTVATNSPFINKKEISLNYEGLFNVSWGIPYNSNGIDFKAIQTSSTLYIYKKNNGVWELEETLNGFYSVLTNKDILIFWKNNLNASIDICSIYNGTVIKKNFLEATDDMGLNFAVWKDTSNNPYFIFRTCTKNNGTFSVDFTSADDVNYYYYDLTDGTTSGSGTIAPGIFFEPDNYIVNVVSDWSSEPPTSPYDLWGIGENGDVWIKDTQARITEKGRALCTLSSGTITIGTYQDKHYYPAIANYNSQNHCVIISTDLWTDPDLPDRWTYVIRPTPWFYFFELEQKEAKVLITPQGVRYTNSYRMKTRRCKWDWTQVSPYYYSEEDAFEDGCYALYNHLLTLRTYDETLGNNVYISNYYNGNGDMYIAGGCTTGVDGSADFSANFTEKYNDFFSLVYNANEFANISWCGKIFEPWLSIDNTYCPPIWSESKQGFYYLINNKWYLVTEKQNAGYIEYILDRYVLLNVKLADGDVFNIYDTKTEAWFNFASDWDNRVFIGYTDNVDYSETVLTNSNYQGYTFAMEIGTGINVNYLSGNIASAIFKPVIYNQILTPTWNTKTGYINAQITQNCVHLEINERYPHSVEVYYSTTLNGNPVTSTPEYICYYDNFNITISSLLQGQIFPLEEGVNIIFNTPLTVSFIVTTFSIYYIYINNIYYQLNVLNDEILLMYSYGSGLTNITELFNLQGNAYIIRNNVISTCNISGGVVQNVQTVISCKNLIFMGTNVNTAFFYSPANKKILGFTGNRNFEEIAEFNDIETLYKYYYAINFKTFFILSNIGCICIADEGYISIIKNNVYNNFILYGKSFGLLNSVTGQWNIFSLYEDGVISPVKIETSFYGFGNNQVTIIDTWYVRLYADEAFNGSIKFKVTSLTNKGTESEETEFLITSDMFDKVTNSYYLRYQPKLQRGVGLSLSIESDYDIIELSCSAVADTTVQLSKPFSKQNVINGGKI